MKLAAIIPKCISNKVVLGFLNFLRVCQRTFRIGWRRCNKHIALNESAITRVTSRSIYERKSELIENQNDFKDILFGKSTLSYAGCEIIATYNALIHLGLKVPLANLINEFERDGMVLSGRFGTAPKAISDYFLRNGFKVHMTNKEEEFEMLGEASSNMILTLYNNKENILDEVHTVCITREADGLYAHNVYGNGIIVGPKSGLLELIDSFNRGKAKGISLIAIEDTGVSTKE